MKKISFFVFFICFRVAAADYFGVIEPQQTIKVGSPVMGIVDEMPVDRGDFVKKDTLLARLNSEVEIVDHALAKTQLVLAEKQYQRQYQLQRNSLSTEADLEKARAEFELAKLQAERSEILVNQRQIVSPVNGVITKRLVRTGEYVYEQTPVVEIAQINPLSVELLVPFSEYGKIQQGMKTQVIVEEPIGGIYIAEVDVVDTVMDAASATFGVRLKLPNPDAKIPSGVRCIVRFERDIDISQK